LRVDYWVPLDVLGPRITKNWRTAWDAQWMNVVVRLHDDTTTEHAEAELTSVLRSGYTGDDPSIPGARVLLAPLLAGDAGQETTEARVLRWLSGVSLAVLLIACANVTSLLLARGTRRTREVGIQLALGVSRAAIVRGQLVESLVLGAAGAAGGLALAALLTGIARRSLLAHVEWTTASIGPRVAAVAVGIGILSAIVVGLLPALGVSRTDPAGAMRHGVRDGGRRRSGLRGTLTVVQAALSVVLLVGAGLFVRSLWNARTVDLGIDAGRVLVAEVRRGSLGRIADDHEREAERRRRQLFYLSLLDRVRALPGVEHAGAAVGLPFGNRFSMRVRAPGIEEMPRVNGVGPGISAVTRDYFATVGTRILEGRPFTDADGAGSAPVAIVNDVMARTVWPGESAIGKCVIVGAAAAPCAAIVGVAGNTHRSRLRENPFMHVYLPHGQEVGFGGAVLLVRGGDDPLVHAAAVRRILTEVDPTITFVETGTIQERIDPQLRSWKLGSAIFVFSGLLALLVAAAGVYSILACLVADRRHEIGVRIALGARAGHVTGLIVRHGFGLAVVGVAVGGAIAAALAPLVEPLLFDVPGRDPLVFGLVAGTLLAVAALASVAPSRRANRVNPLEALQHE
jgi:predicted permease